MKTLRKKYPILSSYVLGIVLFGLALFISGLLNKGVIKDYFPYLGPILLLLATWLLYKWDQQSLEAIGLNLKLKNLALIPFGVLIGSGAFLGSRLIRAWYLGETVTLSPSIDWVTILSSFYFILPQVATEEFLFRGYLFKKTIHVSNIVIANVIFSLLFMLIHVLDDQVLSNTGMLILLAVTIPVGHLLFATALLRSNSLNFPIGIHLGNNWATRHLIKTYGSGDSILVVSDTGNFETWTPFIITLVLTNGFFLLVTWLIWKWGRFAPIWKLGKHRNRNS